MDMFLGESKITRSGQITLDKKIRKELGVREGDYIYYFRKKVVN
jgi:AbrB family looped-hinge helix DNA binding protein